MYCLFCKEGVRVIIGGPDGDRECGIVPKDEVPEDVRRYDTGESDQEKRFDNWDGQWYTVDCPYDIYGESIRIINPDPHKLPLVFGEIKVNGCIGSN